MGRGSCCGGRQRQVWRGDIGAADERHHQENDVSRHEPEGPEAEELHQPQAPS